MKEIGHVKIGSSCQLAAVKRVHDDNLERHATRWLRLSAFPEVVKRCRWSH